MPNFEQNLSICVIISRVALITIRAKYFTVFSISKSEQGREALSSIEESRHTETEVIQILFQLPAVVLYERDLDPCRQNRPN